LDAIFYGHVVTNYDFVFNKNLGFISLNTPLNFDEVLAVAFQYTYNGQTYQVGELQNDIASRGQDEVILLKLIRPAVINTTLPTWNLQMKNIYSMGGGSISKDNFQLRIVYRDDSSGVDNPALPKGKTTKDVPLVQLLNLDRLDPTNELRPDGNFDYIEGITVDTRNGRIIFPITEPFGSFLRTKFDLNDPVDAALANKYVFQEMYTGTKSDALQAANKAKYCANEMAICTDPIPSGPNTWDA
jgi:cell surface protein SprA